MYAAIAAIIAAAIAALSEAGAFDSKEQERIDELRLLVRGKNWPANLTGGIGINNFRTYTPQQVANAMGAASKSVENLTRAIEAGDYSGPARRQVRYLFVYTEILNEMREWVDENLASVPQTPRAVGQALTSRTPAESLPGSGSSFTPLPTRPSAITPSNVNFPIQSATKSTASKFILPAALYFLFT